MAKNIRNGNTPLKDAMTQANRFSNDLLDQQAAINKGVGDKLSDRVFTYAASSWNFLHVSKDTLQEQLEPQVEELVGRTDSAVEVRWCLAHWFVILNG